jgi:uncharacterized membrane protein
MGSRGLLALVRVIAAAVVLVALGSDIAGRAGYGSDDLVKTLSYFTVQANVIGAAVLLLAAATWRRPASPTLDWLRGAAVVYLVVTMVIYNVLLATGDPMTWTNAVVHVLFPIYLIIDWLVDSPGSRIGWRRAMLWLAYPTVYIAYTFIRGAFVGWYPYPFFDLDANSAATVALYTAGLYAFGIIVIAGVRLSGNWLSERRQASRLAVATGIDGA